MFVIATIMQTGHILSADIFCPFLFLLSGYIISMVRNTNQDFSNIQSKDQNMTLNIQEITNEIYASLPMVTRFFLGKTRNMPAAEDAAMNGIVKAIENIDKYNGKSKVSTWVITVAYRLWLDGIKAHSNSKTTYTGDMVFLENMGGTYEDVQSLDNQVSIWDMVSDILSEKQAVVVLAHYRDGLKYREVAEALDIPIGSVMSRLNGAKKKLAKSGEFANLFGEV